MRLRWMALITVSLLLSASLCAPSAAQEPTVHIAFFHSPNCSHCENVARDVLPLLKDKYGSQLEIASLDIADARVYQALLDLEAAYGVSPEEAGIPEVFVGEHVLIGEFVIRDLLEGLVEQYLAAGGVEPVLTKVSGLGGTPVSPTPPHATDESRLPEEECRWCGRPGADAPAIVHLYYFYDRLCEDCVVVRTEVLDPLREKYGASLSIDARDIEGSADDYRLMLALERTRGSTTGEIPQVFIGDQVLQGATAIRENLANLIERYGQEGGVELPQPDTGSTAATVSPEKDAPPIHAAYFHQVGCEDCTRVSHDLRFLQDRYPQLVVDSFDVREEALLAEWLGEKASVPHENRLVAPAIFIGDGALVGADLNVDALEELILRYATSGADASWHQGLPDEPAAASSIAERFRSFGPLTVVAAGLIDGVNPCAFATIIVFVSYLALMGRKGKEILSVGMAFTLGVFIAYLAVGVGLYKILEALPIISVVGRWLNGLTAVLCLVLACGSLYDYFQAKRGRPDDMRFKLPQALRQRVNRVIRERAKGSTLAISAMVTGLIVSLLELACTGQVYLPTIIFVMGVPELRARGFVYLLLYNTLFVVPLLAVFLFVYHGSNSRQLMRIMKEQSATIKLATAVLLFSIALWLGLALF